MHQIQIFVDRFILACTFDLFCCLDSLYFRQDYKKNAQVQLYFRELYQKTNFLRDSDLHYMIFYIFSILIHFCHQLVHLIIDQFKIQQNKHNMNKNKTIPNKQQPKSSNNHQTQQKKPLNQFKTLYLISRLNRIQNKQMEHINKVPANSKNKNIPKQMTQRSKCVSDSLDKFDALNQQEQQVSIQKSMNINEKKISHNRSQSCPFMNPIINPINTPFKVQVRCQKNQGNFNKFTNENESKRTLKKSSTLHRKNKRIVDKKYSIGNSQLSQQSNTVIVHSLPIQHLSSMLYSLNHQKERGFKKGTSRSPDHVLSGYTDLYFQTRVQQQIKMYNLNQELTKLQKQSQNIKIKQEILQKLANKFDKSDAYNQSQESLLIHQIK